MSPPLPRLSEITREEARRLAVASGAKPFHGDELWRWIVGRFALAPSRMTNLPAAFRAALEGSFDPRPSRVSGKCQAVRGMVGRFTCQNPHDPEQAGVWYQVT